MTLRRAFEIVVPGEPRGVGRPRFGRGRDGSPRVYVALADREYADRIALAWRDAGCPYLPSTPWRCELVAEMERPKAHRRASGELSAKGLQLPHPTRKPDADNILKVVDALVRVAAVPDDASLVEARVVKTWAEHGEPRLVIRVESA